jgi:hypothetical protein
MDQDTSKDELCKDNPFLMGCGLTRDQKSPEAKDDSFMGTVKKLGHHAWEFLTGKHNEPQAQQAQKQMNEGMY